VRTRISIERDRERKRMLVIHYEESENRKRKDVIIGRPSPQRPLDSRSSLAIDEWQGKTMTMESS